MAKYGGGKNIEEKCKSKSWGKNTQTTKQQHYVQKMLKCAAGKKKKQNGQLENQQSNKLKNISYNHKTRCGL